MCQNSMSIYALNLQPHILEYLTDTFIQIDVVTVACVNVHQ